MSDKPRLKKIGAIWRCNYPDGVDRVLGLGLTPKAAYEEHKRLVNAEPYRNIRWIGTQTLPKYKRPEMYGVLYEKTVAPDAARSAPTNTETYHINQGRVTHVT